MNTREKIWFFSEDTEYIPGEKGKWRALIRQVIEKEGFRTGEINIVFCSDEYLARINLNYLKHNTLTDIISFDLSEKRGIIKGDIFISIERARENAVNYGVTLRDEIRRLLIHGTLHLAGYKDKTVEDKHVMTIKEDYYLSLPAK